ncbi:MAG: hypothetical protein K2Q17_18530 [Nitrospiraceae bacterium]|jgi:hypothetical protein|nr:hypothetical protein [Nitrospiraceae bacterium]
MGVRKRPRKAGKEIRGDYRFDYAKAKPNRSVIAPIPERRNKQAKTG